VERVRPVLAVLVLVAIVAVIVRSGILADFSVERLRVEIEAYGTLAPLVFMGLLIAGFFVPAPALMLIGLGGAMFGPVAAFLYGWSAAVVGTALPFFLVRQVFGRHVDGAGAVRFRRLREIDARLAQHGFATVLVLRLLLCMAPPLNFALGATRVRWRDYVLGTAIGITPGIALGAYLGDAVTSAESWTALVHPTLLLPVLLGVALMIGGARASRRLFGSEPSR
jgi:phospholipase D1/2